MKNFKKHLVLSNLKTATKEGAELLYIDYEDLVPDDIFDILQENNNSAVIIDRIWYNEIYYFTLPVIAVSKNYNRILVMSRDKQLFILEADTSTMLGKVIAINDFTEYLFELDGDQFLPDSYNSHNPYDICDYINGKINDYFVPVKDNTQTFIYLNDNCDK